MLEPVDVLAIQDLISLYGHVIDERQWDRVGEIFTADALYDVSDFASGVHRGADAIRSLWVRAAAAGAHPIAHHATNVLIRQDADGTVRVVSKGIGLRAGGQAGSTVYRDIVVRTADGWRIGERIALKRRSAEAAT
jgi:ketosteroid isomerase-like protein